MDTYMFQVGGRYYIMRRKLTESLDLFLERCWFVSKQKPKSKSEFEDYEKISRIWINCKYDGCKYNNDIMCKIKNCESKL